MNTCSTVGPRLRVICTPDVQFVEKRIRIKQIAALQYGTITWSGACVHVSVADGVRTRGWMDGWRRIGRVDDERGRRPAGRVPFRDRIWNRSAAAAASASVPAGDIQFQPPASRPSGRWAVAQPPRLALRSLDRPRPTTQHV
jgi:hypothetical protein